MGESIRPRLDGVALASSELLRAGRTSRVNQDGSIHDAPDSLFEHEELDTSRNQIRLVQFCPADTIDGLKFRITLCRIGEIPYHALSYVWGPPEPVKPVFDLDSCEPDVARKRILIRQNLHDYLQMCIDERRIDDHRYFWIDQLCIDQSKIVEKNHQVRLMGRVFREARTVHVWLGKDLDRRPRDNEQKGHRVSRLTDLFRNVEQLGMNPYWSRLWVLQEFILAQDVLIEHGTRYMGGVDLHFDDESSMPPILPWILQARLIQTQRYTCSVSLYDCFESTADSKCEDPRDKIFGLQSLLGKDDRVVVDYAKSTPQVFLEGAAILILSSRSRYLLPRSRYIISALPQNFSGRRASPLISPLTGQQIEDAARCMYFFGRGMGVLSSCGWVSIARRLDTWEVSSFIGAEDISSGDTMFECLVELLRSMLGDDLSE